MKTLYVIRCYDNDTPKYWIKYKTERVGSRWVSKFSINCFYSSLKRAEAATKDESFGKKHFEILEFSVENYSKAIQY